MQKFLLLEERTPPKVKDVQSPRISLRNVSAAWNDGGKNVITEVSLEASSNQLVAIVGPVGSGKVPGINAAGVLRAIWGNWN